MQESSPALAAAELLERQHGGSAAFVLKLEREVKNISSHFGSVSHQVSDGKCDYFYRLEFVRVVRQIEWCFESSESVTQSLLQFLCANKLRPLPVLTASDLLELLILNREMIHFTINCHGGNIFSTLSLYRSDALFPINQLAQAGTSQ